MRVRLKRQVKPRQSTKKYVRNKGNTLKETKKTQPKHVLVFDKCNK